VLLLLDATQACVTDQDAHIAGYILESGRAVVLAVNKWDAVDAYQRELLQRSIETRLGFEVRIHPSYFAIKRQGPVWKSIIRRTKANRKMSTPVLTRLLMEAVQFQQPQRSGVFRPQVALCPPQVA
jgi:GTP-binding protein